MSELSKLDDGERRDAIGALEDAGFGALARALKSVMGSGSRPPERPEPEYVPPA